MTHNPLQSPEGDDGSRAMSDLQQLEMLRLLWSISEKLAEVREVERALARTASAAAQHFGAVGFCVVVLQPGKHAPGCKAHTAGTSWDLQQAGRFAAGAKLPDDPTLIAARLRRRGRLWGAILLRVKSQRPWVDRRILTRVASLLDRVVERIDREREREVRSRLDRRIRDRARPHDMFYHILDGVRVLTHYDHSAAIFLAEPSGRDLILIAEQVAWNNIGKSTRIGARIPLSRVFPLTDGHVILSGGAWVYNRGKSGWISLPRPSSQRGTPVLDAMDHDALASSVGAPEAQTLTAAVDLGNGGLCVVRVVSSHPEAFGPYEADLLGSFIPQITAAVETQSRDAALVRTERQNAIAELARGVAHDVSNALGAALPLVQVVKRELEQGVNNPAEHVKDLHQVERSLRLSREIFDQMLRFAKRTGSQDRVARVQQVIDEVLAVLAPNLERTRVRVERRITAELPPLPMSPIDLAQVLLNLITNARDAMTGGGTLTIRAEQHDDEIAIIVDDTGTGIPVPLRSRVFEPFFTTKPSGNGLGLAICRSIVWEAKGSMQIADAPGGGASVSVRLPLHAPDPPREPEA